MDKAIIRSLFLENWTYILIIVLGITLFKTCEGSKELQIANKGLKKGSQGISGKCRQVHQQGKRTIRQNHAVGKPKAENKNT